MCKNFSRVNEPPPRSFIEMIKITMTMTTISKNNDSNNISGRANHRYYYNNIDKVGGESDTARFILTKVVRNDQN